jgi:hypothetical protein
MQFTLSKNAGSTPVIWKLTHRLVKPGEQYRGKGLGSYTLKMTEDLLKKFQELDKKSPDQVEISTTRPSLVGFGLANRYKFRTPEEKRIMEQYWTEREIHSNDPKYILQGILPSFRELHVQIRHVPNQDMALADSTKLKTFLENGYHYMKGVKVLENPGGFITLGTDVGIMEEIPFLVRTCLRKHL